jgi:hypothetical protein
MGHSQAFNFTVTLIQIFIIITYYNKNLDQYHDKVKDLRTVHVAETCSLI